MNNLISSNIDPNGIVTGGIREGKNLFYSFTEFSITNNEEVFFTNTEDIDNIFLRVTGDFSSQINGTIKIENDTNLFLINPTGMIFKDGASLDIDGDFFGSTAESILFPDNISFSTSESELQALLSQNIPIGLSLGDNPTEIELDLGTSLNPDTDPTLFGNSLTLLGGDINIQDSKLSSKTITLGTLADSGIVNLEDGNLTFLEDVRKGNISITLGSELTVTGDEKGFDLSARNFTLDDASGIIGEENNKINIKVDESVLIDNDSFITSEGGDIEIVGKNINIINSSSTKVEGNSLGGNLSLSAAETITLGDGSSIIETSIIDNDTAGEIVIEASDLRIDSNEGVVVNPINSEENTSAGNITLDTGGNIVLTPGDFTISTSIYRLRNSNVPGAYIYVGTEERDNILNNYSNFVDEGFAFQAGISSSNDLEPIYRFRNLETPGSYLFTNESERSEINSNLTTIYQEEGLAFYAYGAGSRLGEEFSRFRNFEQPGGSILVTGGERDNIKANLSEWIDEGIIFESL